MNMYVIYLDIWIFGDHWSRNEILTRKAFSGHHKQRILTNRAGEGL
jgi:hypothetical protein